MSFVSLVCILTLTLTLPKKNICLWANFIVTVQPEVAGVIAYNSTAVWDHDVPVAATERRGADPSSGSWRRAVCCHTSTKRCSSILSPAQTRSRKQQPSSLSSTWVRKESDVWIIHFVHFGADDGGGNGLVFTETSWQRRGLRGNRGSGFGCFSLSRFASLLIYFILFIYFFLCLFSFPCARRRERCLQNCCAAPWLWSCMSTLWAPISATMTGITWFNEWHPARCSVLLFSLSLQVVLVRTRGVLCSQTIDGLHFIMLSELSVNSHRNKNV